MYNGFYVIFNNSTDKEKGIVTTKRPNIPSTIPRYEEQEVSGGEGNLNTFIGFEDLKLPVEFNFYSTGNLNLIWRKVKAWLLNIDDNKLTFSDDREVYYKVKKVIIPEDIERTKKIGRFQVTFICYPFTYSYDGLEEIELHEGLNIIYNEGSYKSNPIFKIYAEGIISLSVNNKSVSINIGQKIIVDVERELSYRSKEEFLNRQFLNKDIRGDYKNLKLIPGENTINISVKPGGRLDKIELIPNWRFY
ncbi:distal tail protein Dit [Clostridium baratii]|uniref:distal tail protein Dit n=1 Tax=Clostridium baratii TaxID=1561 RepID=UPI0030D1E35C